MIETLESPGDAILAFRISDKLHDVDYKTFVPEVEKAVDAHGRVRMLIEFVDFHGWDMHALWDDVKFAATHCLSIERIAMVGDSTWEKWMAGVCRPFTMAKIKYFDISKTDDAWAWLTGD